MGFGLGGSFLFSQNLDFYFFEQMKRSCTTYGDFFLNLASWDCEDLHNLEVAFVFWTVGLRFEGLVVSSFFSLLGYLLSWEHEIAFLVVELLSHLGKQVLLPIGSFFPLFLVFLEPRAIPFFCGQCSGPLFFRSVEAFWSFTVEMVLFPSHFSNRKLLMTVIGFKTSPYHR